MNAAWPARPTGIDGPAAEHRNALQRRYAAEDRAFGATCAPSWAGPESTPIPATIPFIGERYGAYGAPRLLVYASAEHLGTAKKRDAPWFKPRTRHLAFDRHHVAWREGWTGTPAQRHVGIAPYEDGPLLVAAALLWRWEHATRRGTRALPDEPAALTESVSVANFSKYAETPTKTGNQDPNAEECLRDSWPYVRADIDVLRPNLVLLAKTVTPALTAELAQFAAFRGCHLVIMPQGGAQGRRHAGGHLGRMRKSGARPPDIDAAHWRLAGGKAAGLDSAPMRKWLTLLRARYEATTLCAESTQTQSPTPLIA